MYSQMITHLYTVTWNEADILGFFFRHYDPWIDRYIVYDNGSEDETLALLRAHPRVEVRRFEWTAPGSFGAEFGSLGARDMYRIADLVSRSVQSDRAR